MTASTPPLVDVIAGVLREHWTFTTHGDFDALVDRCDGCHENIFTHGTTSQTEAWAAHQARAVLDALTKAGGVEWGVRLQDKSIEHVYSQSAGELVAMDYGTVEAVVSRITGPWTVVADRG